MADKNLNRLKRLVISLGVLLVLGFILVIAAAAMKYKANTLRVCTTEPLNMHGHGKLVDTRIDNNRLHLTFLQSDDTVKLVELDYCTGKELRSVTINTD